MASSAVAYAALMIGSSACSVCGNSMLLLVSLLNKNLRTDTWPLTCSFCLCDLALGLSIMPLSAHTSILRPTEGYPSEGTLCQASAFIFVLLQLASVHSLTWVTVDKFTEICFALSYARVFTARRAWAVLVAVWSYCLLIGALPLVGFGNYGYSAGRYVCAPSFRSSCMGFNVLFVGLGIIAPILAMCCLYGYIVYVAKKQARRGTFVCNEQHCFYVPANNYLRSSVVMIATVVCLLVCWMPYIVICFYESLTGRESPEPVSAVATWLMLFTSALNPWINSMTQTRYRAALWLSLTKLRQTFQQRRKTSLSQVMTTQPASARESCSSAPPPPPSGQPRAPTGPSQHPTGHEHQHKPST
ncbi:adenosine receptor A3 [Alosa sapidissima]|uniref:adenosine receptor A3 n=1 Tax=Alosa sapidissima TaxID=34773 RepID=UPI001C0991B4|nr:adenosine receptor A3 [Alosa sapidissima]